MVREIHVVVTIDGLNPTILIQYIINLDQPASTFISFSCFLLVDALGKKFELETASFILSNWWNDLVYSGKRNDVEVVTISLVLRTMGERKEAANLTLLACATNSACRLSQQ